MSVAVSAAMINMAQSVGLQRGKTVAHTLQHLFPACFLLVKHCQHMGHCISLLAGLDQQQGLEPGCDGPGDASGEKF